MEVVTIFLPFFIPVLFFFLPQDIIQLDYKLPLNKRTRHFGIRQKINKNPVLKSFSLSKFISSYLIHKSIQKAETVGVKTRALIINMIYEMNSNIREMHSQPPSIMNRR